MGLLYELVKQQNIQADHTDLLVTVETYMEVTPNSDAAHGTSVSTEESK